MQPIIGAENRCLQQRSRHHERKGGISKSWNLMKAKRIRCSTTKTEEGLFFNDMKGCLFFCCLLASSWLTGFVKLPLPCQHRVTCPLPEASFTRFLRCLSSHLMSYYTFLWFALSQMPPPLIMELKRHQQPQTLSSPRRGKLPAPVPHCRGHLDGPRRHHAGGGSPFICSL